MNKNLFSLTAFLGFTVSLLSFVASTGCSTRASYSETRVTTSATYVPNDVIVEDDYVYYPDYEVYYSTRRHQYIYRDGRSWVTRPAPPRMAAEIVLASPSVRLDFHDSPERHHTAVIKSYPKHWRPATGHNEVRKETHDGEHRGDPHASKPDAKEHRDDDDDGRRK